MSKVTAVKPINQSELTNEGKSDEGESMKQRKRNNFRETGSERWKERQIHNTENELQRHVATWR